MSRSSATRFYRRGERTPHWGQPHVVLALKTMAPDARLSRMIFLECNHADLDVEGVPREIPPK
ncbi:hypothetical protein J6590_048502 [Homalodisca vitripennis]|nr:hypothetical protein J6590_048502 [Homalodisca vitripennis]